MITTYATTKNLACLLDISKKSNAKLVDVPEPYSMQRDLTIYITYDVYKEYIKLQPMNSFLSNSMMFDRVKQLIALRSSETIRFFYSAVAGALGKEIVIADSFNCRATTILPQFSKFEDTIQLSQIIENFDKGVYHDMWIRLYERLARRGYKLENDKRNLPLNHDLKAIAVFMQSLVFLENDALPKQYYIDCNL